MKTRYHHDELSDNYYTQCEFLKNISVGSVACRNCRHNYQTHDTYVECKYEEEETCKWTEVDSEDSEFSTACGYVLFHSPVGILFCSGCGKKIEFEESCEESFEEYEQKVLEWSRRVGLSSGSNLKKQSWKLVEEFGEFFGAILREDQENFEEELGDLLVVLIQMNNRYFEGKKTLVDCLKKAYEKINSRTGKLVNGDFLKD